MLALFLTLLLLCLNAPVPVSGDDSTIKLPAPRTEGSIPIETAIRKRRSVRSYSSKSLNKQELSQLLWAAQGVTSEEGFRTAPSAGALYPLEVYVVTGNVQDIPPGVYRYRPQRHELIRVKDGDLLGGLSEAALGQKSVRLSAASLVFAGVYKRSAAKYGKRARRYVHIETGHAAQNVYLQATALGLGTVMVGAFNDKKVRDIVGMKKDEAPLAIMPVGNRK